MERVGESNNEIRHYDHLVSSNIGLHRMPKNIEISRAIGMDSTNSSPISSCSDAGYIEHPVSKFDTLAGVAIKYGVEVADIKKMNALVTDFQMFALKSLQIPPGKHPPSPSFSDDLEISSRQSSSEHNLTRLKSFDLFDSFQSLRVKSSILNGHHSHTPVADQQTQHQGSQMTAYRKGESDHLETEPIHKTHHRKSKSLVSDFEFIDVLSGSNEGGAEFKGNDKLVRRRQKSVADFSADNRCNGEVLSMPRKSLDMRLERNGAEGMDDANEISRKSSKYGSSVSRWSVPSWNLTTDLQALSSAVVTKSLFDGMPKPTTRFKGSLD